MASIIDCDQHLYESRTMWRDHIDPDRRDDALAIVDDELGYPWLTWRGQELDIADVQLPGETATLGERRNRRGRGLAPEYNYDEALPDDYWQPAARAERIAGMGVDEAVLFPNFGLLWERRLSGDLGALTANMAAWNRWCASVVVDGAGRLSPVAHLTLRPGVARRTTVDARAGRRPPRDDRAGSGRRPADVRPGARSSVAVVRRARRDPGVPCGRSAARLR